MSSVSIQRTEFPNGPRYKPICSEHGALNPGQVGYKSPKAAEMAAKAHLRNQHKEEV